LSQITTLCSNEKATTKFIGALLSNLYWFSGETINLSHADSTYVKIVKKNKNG